MMKPTKKFAGELLANCDGDVNVAIKALLSDKSELPGYTVEYKAEVIAILTKPVKKSRKYYSLCERIDGQWYPQFGDYDRSVVVQEKADYDSSVKKKDLKVIVSGASKDEVTAAIRKLNDAELNQYAP